MCNCNANIYFNQQAERYDWKYILITASLKVVLDYILCLYIYITQYPLYFIKVYPIKKFQ